MNRYQVIVYLLNSYPKLLRGLLYGFLHGLIVAMTFSRTMRGMVYQIRDVHLNNNALNRKKDDLVNNHLLYELNFWLTIILSTVTNTFVWETVSSPPQSLFISIGVTLFLFKLPEWLLNIRFFFAGLRMGYLECINILWYYNWIVMLTTAIDIFLIIGISVLNLTAWYYLTYGIFPLS
ncbi:unnamed protein product [Rotaria sp. Silwood2]|nr:unnamed protein product [Rotaria sp. Silwood2]CAF2516102.1 unnamed protein product [Rotaria sp. Silwood2]CAF2751261.1 unnamed protein product [Rotaria sp. Silwood2]CAF3051174.1 unnamed protein product [Rotaria sp. Silwood2]CAF4155156.1 unnamed protein product [Rotaria sp. Silwood2]